MSFNAAVEDLARRFGVLLPLPPEVSPAAGGVDYLEGRGSPRETATHYRLGYAGEGWQDLLSALGPEYGPEALLAKGF